ncbi:MAG: efflux RND transporter permease subunit [Francisellaceae bacterium]|mgnify:CR=1 FL=1|jgi:copper/silver efflux system protein|nr:efflux RND transporter permease subunit [Francisellaceae bacterium]
MLDAIIRGSIRNRVFVLIIIAFLVVAGLYVVKETPVDAIPDLSDVQVIIKTSFPGQAPQVVEDQVTYPLSTAMLAVPKAVTVRAYSFFGDSYIYVIFEDGTDPYWARSRVLEYLSQVSSKLPANARPELGPDATGVGWVYQYALVDETGKNDLSQLRSLQDWFLKYELQTAYGVSEVATIGGMVKQYQITIEPNRLRAYGIPLSHVKMAIQKANQEVGASVIELGEAEHMVSATGYLKGTESIKNIPLGVTESGTPILLSNVADVSKGPQMRRGIADLDGRGEVVGGTVIMRQGENALKTINAVKEKLNNLKKSLPNGVEIVETYNRANLINQAVDNLSLKLVEEFLVVALVCMLFLFHFRSSLVIIVSLPVGILVAFIIMYMQGINANIMSLGGIAIAIGAMVDAAIVMVENVHKHFEKSKVTDENRWKLVEAAAVEVGPPLFFSLVIITLSFLPVFALQAQEGKLFAPLAYTKTYAMAAAAGLSITLVPVLMGYFIRGKITPEHENPINRFLIKIYRPFINLTLKYPLKIVIGSFIILLFSLFPLSQIGSEFMPDLDEGDWMYMPTTLPGISIGKARQVLQQTDRIIKSFPEVKSVFGKIGRAETATDPAPLTMIETVIQFKPRDQWRKGMTPEKLKLELDKEINFPGITNAWVMPIKTRIDMLATGIKTPVGIKISGPSLEGIQELASSLEPILNNIDGTASVYGERVAGGRYVNIDIDRIKAARYGINISDIHEVIATAIGGMNVTNTIEGLERYPVNLRYPQSYRHSVGKLRMLPIISPTGAHIALADVANIYIADGPPAIKSENARLTGWVLIDIEGRDLGSYVAEAQTKVSESLKIPSGYSINWSGQYEYMERAQKRLMKVIPLTIAIIIILLYLSFRKFAEVIIIMGTLPLALVGGIWLLYLLGYHFSVAVMVGFIALAGVAVEVGVLMLVYLNQAFTNIWEDKEGVISLEDLKESIIQGALLRIRPIIMTVSAIITGLLPIMLGSGTGSEVMRRIAAPMFGGMLSATILTLLVIPAIFLLWKSALVKTKAN